MSNKIEENDQSDDTIDLDELGIVCGEQGLEVLTKPELIELQQKSSILKNTFNGICNSFVNFANKLKLGCSKMFIMSPNTTEIKRSVSTDSITNSYYKNVTKSLSTHEYFSFDRFNSKRGAENIHIYFWIGLDLGWMFQNLAVSLVFGFLSLFWIGFMANNYIIVNNTLELYMCMINFMWVFANVLWCVGDIGINNESKYAFSSGMLMTVGLFFWLIQKLWLQNNGLLKEDRYTVLTYHYAKLTPHFQFLGRNWKECEHIFIFSWLILDIGWAFDSKVLWVIGTSISLLISTYMTIYCFTKEYMIIDSVHYLIQLLWLISNICWSYGDVWLDQNDNRKNSMRNISAWELVGAYCIIVGMYCIWILMDYFGKLPNKIPNQFKAYVHQDNNRIDNGLNFYSDKTRTNKINSLNNPLQKMSNDSNQHRINTNVNDDIL